MTQSIIFDLDYCLSPGDEVGAKFYGPAFEAMRRANHGVLTDAALSKAFAECMRFPFDDVATRFRFSEAMYHAGLRGFAALEVTAPMHGYDDLDELGKLQARRFLVTSGFPRLQRSKLAMLGVAPLFEAVYVDAIGDHPRRGKDAIFAELVAGHGLATRDVWVLGDNADSEIAAGNRLGMITVQILRPGVERSEAARYAVGNLREFGMLLHHAGGSDLSANALKSTSG